MRWEVTWNRGGHRRRLEGLLSSAQRRQELVLHAFGGGECQAEGTYGASLPCPKKRKMWSAKRGVI